MENRHRSVLFFQAEDGIRDLYVTGVPDVCSSDLGEGREPLQTAGVRLSGQRDLRRTRLEPRLRATRDRKSVVEGKSVGSGGLRSMGKKKEGEGRESGVERVTGETSKEQVEDIAGQ